MTPQTTPDQPAARVFLFRGPTKEIISLRNACARSSRVVAYRVEPDGKTARLIFEQRRWQRRFAT